MSAPRRITQKNAPARHRTQPQTLPLRISAWHSRINCHTIHHNPIHLPTFKTGALRSRSLKHRKENRTGIGGESVPRVKLVGPKHEKRKKRKEKDENPRNGEGVVNKAK